MATNTPSIGEVKSAKKENRLYNHKVKERWTEALTGYIFIAPMVIGLITLTLLPIIASLVLSFTNWNFIAGIDQIKWIGFRNFETLFQDDIFTKSLTNNLVFMFVVPLAMAISLLLAVVIDKKIYAKNVFKVIYFMPYISSIVAVAIVFQVLFHPSYGPINQMLIALGLENPPKWLADPSYALVSVMMIHIWIGIGYNLIIYIAGLQSIPRDLYEAADIDGASPGRQFFSITLPLLSPTSFFLLITGIIGSFKVFDLIAVLTEGGPAHSTSVLVYHLYESAFVNLKTGYASSMSIILLICVFSITLIQWVGQRKWVNY